MSTKLIRQWLRFVRSGYRASYFTNDLYELLYLSPGFIAHTNKIGFYKNRFMETDSLDATLSRMSFSTKTKELIDATPVDDIVQARLHIAKLEYSTLLAQQEVLESHINRLREQYRSVSTKVFLKPTEKVSRYKIPQG